MITGLSAEPWTFVCDRCGNTALFRHGMETWRLTYEAGGAKDNRSFCSKICVEEVYRAEVVK